jgi:hypothetical protein
MGKVPHVVYTLCLLPTDSEWEIRCKARRRDDRVYIV